MHASDMYVIRIKQNAIVEGMGPHKLPDHPPLTIERAVSSAHYADISLQSGSLLCPATWSQVWLRLVQVRVMGEIPHKNNPNAAITSSGYGRVRGDEPIT